MSLRSPLGRVRGLGSAKEGSSHWSQQRLTAIALVPLSFWFIVQAIGLAGGHYAQLQAWLSVPGNTTLLVLLLFCLFHHAQLGVQVVIEDYVQDRTARTAALILIKMTTMLLGVFAVVSALRVAVMGA
jgi:succinate dehydrogenase / fumarate reductase membrane anchor subunit